MKTLAFILQVICLILVIIGITIELEYDANLGFLLITIGSILFATSTKIRKIDLERENKQLKKKGLHYEKFRGMEIDKNSLQAIDQEIDC